MLNIYDIFRECRSVQKIQKQQQSIFDQFVTSILRTLSTKFRQNQKQKMNIQLKLRKFHPIFKDKFLPMKTRGQFLTFVYSSKQGSASLAATKEMAVAFF
eukprot:TRINITY_DN20087_c0_g1_i4.p3 TRINITY_DN20087_c0_g1~~TRINITY_DN20087_c0_g1_i4.p3  ORF type:complete len:100 (-),score=1.28 TRINITY_DN20087_c0_g1_i4:222-521(-)